MSDSNYKLPAQKTITFEIVKAQREAPTSVTATGTTYKGGTDGRLNNVDSSMEYRKDGENEWHSITGNTVEGLSTGNIMKDIKIVKIIMHHLKKMYILPMDKKSK